MALTCMVNLKGLYTNISIYNSYNLEPQIYSISVQTPDVVCQKVVSFFASPFYLLCTKVAVIQQHLHFYISYNLEKVEESYR